MLAVASPREFVADQERAKDGRCQPGAKVTRTLEIEDEKRRENAPEEELQQQVGGLPRDPGKAPAQSPFGRWLGPLSRFAEGQPEDEQAGPEQESAKTPQIDRPNALADGQCVPDKSAEEGGNGVKAPQDLQGRTFIGGNCDSIQKVLHLASA